MTDLTRQRCANHIAREAVARCLDCGRYFCGECVTEHGGRLLCATCIRAKTAKSARTGAVWTVLVRAGQLVLGLGLLWLVFHYAGQALISVPTAFHEGSVWKSTVIR
jgi:hypothetical protein